MKYALLSFMTIRVDTLHAPYLLEGWNNFGLSQAKGRWGIWWFRPPPYDKTVAAPLCLKYLFQHEQYALSYVSKKHSSNLFLMNDVLLGSSAVRINGLNQTLLEIYSGESIYSIMHYFPQKTTTFWKPKLIMERTEKHPFH